LKGHDVHCDCISSPIKPELERWVPTYSEYVLKCRGTGFAVRYM